MTTKATTVEEYINSLPEEKKDDVIKLRESILKNLPEGYEEILQYGISYVVPLEEYPNTYNGQPLTYLTLAAQKNHIALYMLGAYADEELAKRFEEEYKATGKKFDMGKSCLRFKKVEDLPLEVVEKAIRAMPKERFIDLYTKIHNSK